MPFNKEEALQEMEAERVALEVYLRRNGETPQSIQRRIPKAPPPIESKPIMPTVPPPI